MKYVKILSKNSFLWEIKFKLFIKKLKTTSIYWWLNGSTESKTNSILMLNTIVRSSIKYAKKKNKKLIGLDLDFINKCIIIIMPKTFI